MPPKKPTVDETADLEPDQDDEAVEPGFNIPAPDETADLEPDPEHGTAVTYIGPFDAVQVNRPDGTRGTVRRGGTFKTTDEHAGTLREQPTNWK